MNLKAIIPNVYISSISYCIKMHKASLLSNVTETCSYKRPCPDHQMYICSQNLLSVFHYKEEF